MPRSVPESAEGPWAEQSHRGENATQRFAGSSAKEQKNLAKRTPNAKRGLSRQNRIPLPACNAPNLTGNPAIPNASLPPRPFEKTAIYAEAFAYKRTVKDSSRDGFFAYHLRFYPER
jgi:hypothetical protein